ncbi:MAG: BatA domain-containing protein [Acidobacteria bacterium]|nr:BatA domain-containing protein [Acidobacteriota bacterium]
MGLSFLAPLFAVGLAAIAIPILVHLTYRQKAIIVPFPSLMFVQKVPFKSMRRQKIRHWLLFLLRCAALAILVLAFSRPFFNEDSIAATLSSASREVVILIDNSHSMSYAGRWATAQQRARDTINDLAPSDRASLVFFSDAAQLAVRSTPEPSVLLSTLEAIEPSGRSTRYAPAIAIAQQLLAESALPAKEVVLITDYQRVGWDPEQAVQLPEGTILTGIDVAEEAAGNLSIATVLLQREAADGGEQFVVNARLVNQGDEPTEDIDVTLQIGGEAVDTRRVTLEPNSALTVQFRPQPVGPDAVRGAVLAGTDKLPGDNTFYFIINPGETINVLLVENNNAHDTDSFFIGGALSVGTRPAFRLQRTSVGQLQASDLSGIDAVILNDTAFPSGAAGSAVRNFVEAGGGVLIALGELVHPGEWQGSDATALAPRFSVDIVDRNAEFGGALASYDRNHPVFEIFSAPRSGDFTAPNFYRYWRLEPGPDDLVIAGFDDGNPALVARSVGSGRVLVWPTTLDRFWNDLVIHGQVFVPFIQRATRYVAGYQEAEAWQTVGGSLRLATLEEMQFPEGTAVELTAPDGTTTGLVATGMALGSADPAAASDRIPLDAPGFYALAWSDDSGDHELAVAANLDRTESDLSKLDQEELAAALTYRGAAAGGFELDHQVTAEDREARQSWWWYLLVLVFVVLAAETALSNRLSPSSATGTA